MPSLVTLFAITTNGIDPNGQTRRDSSRFLPARGFKIAAPNVFVFIRAMMFRVNVGSQDDSRSRYVRLGHPDPWSEAALDSVTTLSLRFVGMKGERRGKTTSHDVAAEAGVSQATVARVFSSPDKVAPATQDQVRNAAARLGYVPNAIARSLKSQRTDIVGAVVPGESEYWQGVLTAFSRRLADQGKQLLLFSFVDAHDVDGALDSVERYRLDGLVLASSTIGHEHLVRMQRSNRRVVAFNQPAASGLLPLVTVDNEAGARDLAEHVVTQGVRTAAFVGTVASASTDQIRYRGAATTLADHGIACPYMETGAFSYEAGYKVAARILDGDDQPEALVVGSDEVALGLIDGLRTGGLDVPGDMLVTGFDGLPQASWAGYDLTTLVQPIEVLVAETLAIIFDDAEDVGRPERVVPGTLREGKTTWRADA